MLYRRQQDDALMTVRVVATEPTLRMSAPEELFRGLVPASSWLRRTYDVAPGGRFLTLYDPDAGDGRSSPGRVVLIRNWLDELRRLVPRQP